MTRRGFVAAAAGASALRGAAAGRPVLCIFSKHLAKLNYDELGKVSRALGFDGVDLTVRAKGHVLPGRAAEDLPRAVEAIRSHGLEAAMITTELVSAADPTARPTLSTAGRLKVRYFKPGYHHYAGAAIDKRIAEVRRDLAGLVALGREHGVECGFHNHSGDYVGAAVWDTRELLRDLEPRWAGYYFDPGHATIEGGSDGWEISTKLVLPRLKMVALKDFYWAKKGGKWQVEWCPMGQGMVDWPKIFALFASARFTGPMSLHLEYEAKDEQAAIARDLEFIRKQVASAYAG